MGIIGRAAVVLAVFVCVAVLISHSLMAHELADGDTPVAQVRLASWMAGLFAGGVAAVVAGIAMIIRRGR